MTEQQEVRAAVIPAPNRTIADLDGAGGMALQHVPGVIQYRRLDWKLWA